METLFSAHPVLWAIVVAVSALAGVARGWLAYRTAVRREEEHTKRVQLAVARTEGRDRALVVRAAGQLAPATSRRGPVDGRRLCGVVMIEPVSDSEQGS